MWRTGTDIDTEFMHGGGDTTGATNRPGRSVERGEKAVSLGADLPTTPARDLPPHYAVVHLEQFSPTTIAERRRALRRSDDIGEQDRREDTFLFRHRARPGEELLYVIDDRVCVSDTDEVVHAWQLHKPRAGNLLGHVAGLLDAYYPVVSSVQKQRGHADR